MDHPILENINLNSQATDNMNFTRYRATETTFSYMGFVREAVRAFAAVSILLVTPLLTAQAAEDEPAPNSLAAHAHAAGDAIKHDSKVVGAAFKDGAHRVAVAGKAVGHEVATAARRSAEKTKAAFRGEK